MTLQRIEELKRQAHSSDDIEILTELMILRARIEGEHVYLECLTDRLQWNRYPDSIQDQCVAVANKRLGLAFEHIETRVYECGGRSHRIATFRHVMTGLLLNLLPGGTYLMGSESGNSNEVPVHEVTIKAMLMGKYTVRQSIWDKVGGSDDRSWKGPNLPIDTVSWNDVKAWLQKAGSGLRLPSEAEWEYACRAGSVVRPSGLPGSVVRHSGLPGSGLPGSGLPGSTAFCFGESVTPEQVNYDGNYPLRGRPKGLYREKTVSVGSLPSNAFGLHEVHGNVQEWCEDAWIADYKEGPNSHLPRKLEVPSHRIVRGGCWNSLAVICRSAFRGKSEPGERNASLGFRVCWG